MFNLCLIVVGLLQQLLAVVSRAAYHAVNTHMELTVYVLICTLPVGLYISGTKRCMQQMQVCSLLMVCQC